MLCRAARAPVSSAGVGGRRSPAPGIRPGGKGSRSSSMRGIKTRVLEKPAEQGSSIGDELRAAEEARLRDTDAFAELKQMANTQRVNRRQKVVTWCILTARLRQDDQRAQGGRTRQSKNETTLRTFLAGTHPHLFPPRLLIALSMLDRCEIDACFAMRLTWRGCRPR